MTVRLYYADAYCRSFEADVTAVLEHDGRPAVTLDRTAFYPASGGQPFDTGRLGPAEVLETVDAGDVVHVLSAPIARGVRVSGEIDWTRRFDHMQQHTGQHLLSAAFDRLFENPTVGFHMGAEVSTIDLAREATAEAIERAVDAASDIVWENRRVTIRFASKADAGALGLRKEPAREGELRLIDIDGFDVCACGGTHVERTGAVGVIAALGWERLRGGTRITFVCGARALRALRAARDAVAGSVRLLSVLPAELPAAIERLQHDARARQKQVRQLQAAVAAQEGANLAARAPAIAGTCLVIDALAGWDAPGMKLVAAAVVAAGRACAVLVSGEAPCSVVVAASAGTLDAAALLRRLTERFGGRGGGTRDLAQGGGVAAPPADILAAARELAESALRTTGDQ